MGGTTSLPSFEGNFVTIGSWIIGDSPAGIGLREDATEISEGERFSVTSREGALVVNNVLLSATLGIVLMGTLYPLLAETLGAKVSVGPPYFNPMSAVFVLPMLVVLAVGPLLRWRRDDFVRVRKLLILPLAVTLGVGGGAHAP